MRSFVDIIQERHLWTNYLPIRADSCLEFYLHHVASLEATAIGYTVNQRLIKIDDQRFLMRPDGGCT